MGEGKPKVTLIGSALAQQGLEFIYEGPIEQCTPCNLKKACNNLKAGRRYRIVGIRKTRHPCPVHQDGTLAVEVVEAPIAAFINPDMAIRDTRILYEFSCNREDCSSYPLCHPDGITEGEKYVVTDVIGGAQEQCDRGKRLQLVNLMPA
jgi:uncharacterized protein (UPF0179 family)